MNSTISRNKPLIRHQKISTHFIAKETFPIIGMTCASCAVSIESTLKGLPAVRDATVNYANQNAWLSGSIPMGTILITGNAPKDACKWLCNINLLA